MQRHVGSVIPTGAQGGSKIPFIFGDNNPSPTTSDLIYWIQRHVGNGTLLKSDAYQHGLLENNTLSADLTQHNSLIRADFCLYAAQANRNAI